MKASDVWKAKMSRKEIRSYIPPSFWSRFSFSFRALISFVLLFCFVFALPDSHEHDIFSIWNRRTKRASAIFFFFVILRFLKTNTSCVHIYTTHNNAVEAKSEAFYIDVFCSVGISF